VPPLDLLDSDRGQPSAGDIRQNSAVIKKTLESFEIPVEMSEINTGPTVTQYTLKPADGVKLSKITSLSNDLALALASHPIRIEAPIPGKSLVGIEVPNKVRTLVRLKGLLGDSQFQQSASNLLLCLGRDVSGKPIYADLARMPHLLVAGSTGTGKTIFLNALILSLVYHNSPQLLKFILIDPKRVEFPVYNDLPHLLAPVILDSQRAINSLKWLVGEMERRFDVLSAARARDLASYNEQALKNKTQPLPYIVLIIDELADLMAARGKEMEAGIVRLAQMARAIGIHLVVATQRPSVEVITGLIKANITSRISFQVASQIDSRTVLDAAGAEKLLGWGDLLFLSAEVAKPRRLQGAYISDKEVKKVIDWIKANYQEKILRDPQIEEEILGDNLGQTLIESLEAPEKEFNGYSTDDDPLYPEAKKVVIEARKASASLLQRRLRIGYARAARLIDILEEKGLVGPADGAKPREVYGAREESFEEKIDQ
jgi:S-DNA-T family DNA segregation ATPase FtsK/SpoIIIE